MVDSGESQIAGRVVPKLDKPVLRKVDWPKRPENSIRIDYTDGRPPVIRHTPHGLIIGEDGDTNSMTMNKQFRRIEAQVPEEIWVKLGETAQRIAELKDKKEIESELTAIEDDTNREYVARLVASFRELKKLGSNLSGKEALERSIYEDPEEGLKALAFPIKAHVR